MTSLFYYQIIELGVGFDLIVGYARAHSKCMHLASFHQLVLICLFFFLSSSFFSIINIIIKHSFVLFHLHRFLTKRFGIFAW